MIGIISKDKLVRCSWCGEDSTVEEWDKETMSRCKSREMRRDYISLKNTKAYKKSTETYYLCPKCGKWSGGHQLRVL